MRRSVKYGLYGAVLAGRHRRYRRLRHRSGQRGHGRTWWSTARHTKIHTTASTSRASSRTPATTSAAHDIVAPALTSKIKSGETVVYKRGRLLHLSVDGQPRDVWTTAPTVARR